MVCAVVEILHRNADYILVQSCAMRRELTQLETRLCEETSQLESRLGSRMDRMETRLGQHTAQVRDDLKPLEGHAWLVLSMARPSWKACARPSPGATLPKRLS